MKEALKANNWFSLLTVQPLPIGYSSFDIVKSIDWCVGFKFRLEE